MNEILETLKNFDVHTLVGLTIVFWYFTRNIRNEIKEEIKGIRQEIQEIRESSLQQNKRTDRLIEIQGQRTDKLYEMFYELIKETRK